MDSNESEQRNRRGVIDERREAAALERTAATQESQKVRKTNYALIVTVIFLASVLLTLAVVIWDINERAKDREATAALRERENAVNEYLNCVQLFATGVEEKNCVKYRDWILRNTNIRAGP